MNRCRGLSVVVLFAILGVSQSSLSRMFVSFRSMGCIVAELFLGLPLFPGSSEWDQFRRITELLGLPANDLCERGMHVFKFLQREYEYRDTSAEFEAEPRLHLLE